MQQVGVECEWLLTEKLIFTVAAVMHMQESAKKKKKKGDPNSQGALTAIPQLW